MSYTIKPMISADIPAVTELEQSAYQTHWSKRDIHREIEQNQFAYNFVLWKDSILIGVCGFWLLANEAHITTVAIHPQWQRQQLGDWLLLHLIIEADNLGADVVTLELRRSNYRAEALYHKYRFEKVGYRAHYYDDGDDALILTTPPLASPNYRAAIQKQRASLYQKFQKG
jgi:ribosomal-protein-alanine N-acetyltransferase